MGGGLPKEMQQVGHLSPLVKNVQIIFSRVMKKVFLHGRNQKRNKFTGCCLGVFYVKLVVLKKSMVTIMT